MRGDEHLVDAIELGAIGHAGSTGRWWPFRAGSGSVPPAKSRTRRRAAAGSAPSIEPSSASTGMTWLSTEIGRPVRPQMLNRRSDWTPDWIVAATGQSASLDQVPLLVAQVEQLGQPVTLADARLDNARHPLRPVVPRASPSGWRRRRRRRRACCPSAACGTASRASSGRRPAGGRTELPVGFDRLGVERPQPAVGRVLAARPTGPPPGTRRTARPVPDRTGCRRSGTARAIADSCDIAVRKSVIGRHRVVRLDDGDHPRPQRNRSRPRRRNPAGAVVAGRDVSTMSRTAGSAQAQPRISALIRRDRSTVERLVRAEHARLLKDPVRNADDAQIVQQRRHFDRVALGFAERSSFRHHADVVSATRSTWAAVGGCLYRSAANRLAAIPSRTRTNWSSTARPTTVAASPVASSSSAKSVSNSDVQTAAGGMTPSSVLAWVYCVESVMGVPKRNGALSDGSNRSTRPRRRALCRPGSQRPARLRGNDVGGRRLLNPSSLRNLGQINPRPRRSTARQNLTSPVRFYRGKRAIRSHGRTQPRPTVAVISMATPRQGVSMAHAAHS